MSGPRNFSARVPARVPVEVTEVEVSCGHFSRNSSTFPNPAFLTLQFSPPIFLPPHFLPKIPRSTRPKDPVSGRDILEVIFLPAWNKRGVAAASYNRKERSKEWDGTMWSRESCSFLSVPITCAQALVRYTCRLVRQCSCTTWCPELPRGLWIWRSAGRTRCKLLWVLSVFSSSTQQPRKNKKKMQTGTKLRGFFDFFHLSISKFQNWLKFTCRWLTYEWLKMTEKYSTIHEE